MIDSKQLIEYAKNPELALRNLEQLLPLLDSDDETEQGCVSDLLENCGAPALTQIPFLCAQLKSGLAPRVYWSSTLLGRLGSVETLDRSRLHTDLCGVLQDENLELSARERAAWAIGETKPIDRDCRVILEKIVEKAPARLKRLLETALAN
ncbi:MAG: hypothetical protein NTY15_15170 [Planctomycetota bacterium]|nr:hypothetical protein [Planctomycetota bacterium]